MDIIPAILTNSIEEAKAMLSISDLSAPRTQIDIIDGIFVNNKTIFPESLEDEIYTTKIDFHLMVHEPVRWIDRCIRGNADRIIAQVEQMSDQVEFVNEVIKKGASVGLALDLSTDVLSIDPDVFSMLDVVLVMSVDAGFGGQPYNIQALKVISDLAKIRNENTYNYKICDDGGVNISYLKEIKDAGADEVCIGRKIFEGDLSENIALFKKAALV